MSTTQHSDTTAWRVSAAPHYSELLWKNLRCALDPSPGRECPSVGFCSLGLGTMASRCGRTCGAAQRSMRVCW